MNRLLLTVCLTFLSQISLGECNGLKLHAHRGGGTLENSRSSVKTALDGDWDGAEIDIQMLKDGKWVLNHDWTLGRTTSLENKLVNQLDSSSWNDVYLKDKKGALTDESAAFLEQVVEISSEYPKKTLNIEIKQPFNGCQSIHKLVEEMNQQSSVSNWFFTSIDIRNLECIRQLDKTSYVGLVVLDPNRIIQGKFGHKLLSKINVASIKNKMLSSLKNALQGPVGIHVDIRSLLESPDLMFKAKDLNIPIYTYALEQDSDKEHINLMKKLKNRTNMLPTGAIINKPANAFCKAIF